MLTGIWQSPICLNYVEENAQRKMVSSRRQSHNTTNITINRTTCLNKNVDFIYGSEWLLIIITPIKHVALGLLSWLMLSFWYNLWAINWFGMCAFFPSPLLSTCQPAGILLSFYLVLLLLFCYWRTICCTAFNLMCMFIMHSQNVELWNRGFSDDE